MDKITFLGLLIVLAIVTAMTTAFVDPPPAMQPAGEKIPSEKSKSKESSSSSEESSSDDSSQSVDDEKEMLCNVIVRATHDLHVRQSKSAQEITTYLDTDCQNLGNEKLIEQCHEMVAQHGAKIYEHVKNGIEMSQICQKIEDRNEIDFDDEKKAECLHGGGDKCQCCKMHVEQRKMRLRYIVKQIAKNGVFMCKNCPRQHRCREWIRRTERCALKRIEKICPYSVCKHLGYCAVVPKDDDANALLSLVKSKIGNVIGLPSLSLEMLDQQLEAHFTKDVCSEFKQWQGLCVHLAASTDNRRNAKIYMAVINNDTKWINYALQEEVQPSQASTNVDFCDVCKNAIQSSVSIYLQNLELIREALDSTCERCPVKEKCEEFFNKRIDMIKLYLQSLNAGEICSALHLCSSSSSAVVVPTNGDGKCAVCTQRLQPRKDAAKQAINRLSAYFTDLCPNSGMPDCQEFVSEVVIEARVFINEFDVQGACLAMGFCEQSAAHYIDDYEHAFIEEIGSKVCSMLGPFETICQQVVQGNTKQVQKVSLSTTNINDLFKDCEEETDEKNTVALTTDQCSQDNDKCQCCIQRIIQKKKCMKKSVAQFLLYMTQLCKRCPVREQCEQYWKDKEACWDAKIDKICPKKVCIRMGYCKKAEMSLMAACMDHVKQFAEKAFAAFANQVSVQPKVEMQPAANKP